MVFGMFNTMLFTKPIGIIIWKLGANFKVVNLPRPQKQPNPLGSWVVSRYVPYIYICIYIYVYIYTFYHANLWPSYMCNHVYIYMYMCVCQCISPWSFSLKNKATTMSLLLPSRKPTMDDLPVKKWMVVHSYLKNYNRVCVLYLIPIFESKYPPSSTPKKRWNTAPQHAGVVAGRDRSRTPGRWR